MDEWAKGVRRVSSLLMNEWMNEVQRTIIIFYVDKLITIHDHMLSIESSYDHNHHDLDDIE